MRGMANYFPTCRAKLIGAIKTFLSVVNDFSKQFVFFLSDLELYLSIPC